MVQTLDEQRADLDQDGPATVRAFVYDADGADSEVQPGELDPGDRDDHRLVWVDVATDGDVPPEVWPSLGIHPDDAERAVARSTGPRVEAFDQFFRLNVVVVEGEDSLQPVGLLVMVSRDWIVTVHPAGFDLIDRFNGPLKGETTLGELDGPAFAATLLNWLLNGYFRVLESLEAEIDRLDEILLTREVEEDQILANLVRSRRRITRLRKTLAPHRDVFSLLGGPNAEAFVPSESASNFQGLHERVEQALEAADAAREMLLGSFDVFMTQTAQRTNDVMKALTVISVLFLPSVVVAGVMGMNFQVGLFDWPGGFWLTVGSMAGIAGLSLLVAKWKKWI